MPTLSKDDILLCWIKNNGANLLPLTVKNIKLLKYQWRKNYSARMNREKGVWRYRGYDWHIFSYGFAKCNTGTTAINNTLRQKDRSWYLWGDRDSKIGYEISGIKPLNLCGLGEDYILTAMDFKWTAVFTHELDCGPYFSRSRLTSRCTGNVVHFSWP